MPVDLIDRFLQGDRRALARAITWVENGAPEAAAVLRAAYGRGGRAQVVGVTGPPGAGKSTLVDRMAQHYRQQGRTVGIVAVDPTSPFSGGAILGDRIRMQKALQDPGVFARSLATRGHLGGISLATADVVDLMDAFGFDVILVETVGAGQSEVEVMEVAHTTVVVLVPGMGDDVQAIKAGILEIGNVFAVNKADREGADRTVLELEMMLDFAAPQAIAHQGLSADASGHHGPARQVERTAGDLSVDGFYYWRPPVVKAVAKDGHGVAELVEQVGSHLAFLQKSGRLAERRLQDARAKLAEIVTARVSRSVLAQAEADLGRLAQAVAARQTDPYTAAEEILARHFGQRGSPG